VLNVRIGFCSAAATNPAEREGFKKYFCHFERSREVFFGFRKQDVRIQE
jgi:hypothetical protein